MATVRLQGREHQPAQGTVSLDDFITQIFCDSCNCNSLGVLLILLVDVPCVMCVRDEERECPKHAMMLC